MAAVRVAAESVRITTHNVRALFIASRAALRQSQGPATGEGESISRIERLMHLSERMANESDNKERVPVPHRLRGTGVWQRTGPKITAADPSEPPQPLPVTRRMADSYVHMDLPFSTDERLREAYVGGLSRIRMGRLMEDFDSVAGAAAYRYVLPDGAKVEDAGKWGLYLVTAAVDRMDVLHPLSKFAGADLRLSGHVAFATESSLEVFVRLTALPQGDRPETTILIGRFAMACRKYSGGKQPIAKLVLDGNAPAEEELYRMGKESREGKRKRAQESLDTMPPTAAEAKMMHDLFVGRQEIFVRNAPTPEDVVWMSSTELKSAALMHPQERNVHSKVFGGYLMRLAYESAYSTACLFARSPVSFIALDELHFALPVEIGSLLRLDSRVTFSPIRGEHKSFHVSVKASTTDLYTGVSKVTNVFHYTFAAEKPLQRHVLPRSYKQAMQWLDAQRRREHGVSVRKALVG